MRELTRTDAGKLVLSQSMVKTFKQCPREFFYKQIVGIQPKVLSTPLTRGKWIHAMLEAYYADRAEDLSVEGAEKSAWEVHTRHTTKFASLFDEEKDSLGDLPREIKRLMESYFWHYRQDSSWTVHEVERTIEAELPNGMMFRGRVDMVIEDQYGLWIADHKTHKRMPDWTYRLLDEQSPLYIWAARKNGIPVRGFLWNYLLTTAPSKPRMLKNGKRFYAAKGDTTWNVYARAVKEAQQAYPDTFLSDADDRRVVADELRRLKAQRGADTTFFRRDYLEKTDDLIERVVSTTCRTGEAIEAYDWSHPDLVERNVNACKGFMCSYRDLSQSDLLHGGVDDMLVRQNYMEEDAFSYYEESDAL